jgi:hypothetical protein
MSDQASLETVKQAFAHWRATRGSNRRIPDYLWEQVLPLRDSYKMYHLTTALGISSGQFQDYLHRKKLTESENTEPLTFAEVLLPTSLHADATTVELTRPDGTLLRFKNINPSLLTTLLHTFLGTSPCCN